MSAGAKGRWRLMGSGVALVLLVSYVTACQSPQSAQVTSTPSKTARPLPVLATVTRTPVPTQTPTATPLPTLKPTLALPTDTATIVPTQVVAPTVTPGPTLAANICPLTGLEVSNPALLDRRPLAIKVQNAALARPQVGLPQADIVFEHLTEAAITRFTAIYLCQPNVGRVGSTRSARYIDLEIPVMYRSLFAFSGTSPGLYPKFVNADFKEREFVQNWGWNADGFFRDKALREKGVAIEHTLFVDAAKIWATATKLGLNQRQDLNGLDFDAKLPAAGQPAPHIHVPFPSRDMVVDWRYEAKTGKYLRWVEGEPHVDAATGKQLAFDNVIVIYATHVDDMTIFEDYPRRNWPSVQVQLWGTGPAVIFRDGQAVEGLWARPRREDMVVFRDMTGQTPIALKPGNTWIELVPLPGHKWAFKATWDNK